MYVDHVRGRGEQLLAGARKLALAGIVAKKSDSPYLPGRSGAWRKVKIEETADFVVIGIAEPTRATFMRPGLVLALVDSGRLRYVGRVAVGRQELDALEPVVRARSRYAAVSGRGQGRRLARAGAGLRGTVPRLEPAWATARRLRAIQARQAVASVCGVVAVASASAYLHSC
jgi:hypothetical protein